LKAGDNEMPAFDVWSQENLIKFAKEAYVKLQKQQVTWQGLTDEDWKEIEDMPDTFDQGVAWAAAKLKKKNSA